MEQRWIPPGYPRLGSVEVKKDHMLWVALSGDEIE